MKRDTLAAAEPRPLSRDDAFNAIRRINRLYPRLKPGPAQREAARLCKTDLATFRRALLSAPDANAVVPPKRAFSAT